MVDGYGWPSVICILGMLHVPVVAAGTVTRTVILEYASRCEAHTCGCAGYIQPNGCKQPC